MEKQKNVFFSIVSPIYRGENTVKELVRRIKESVSPITQSFEIILVEDHSPDRSWEAIEQCCKEDNRVKGIKLSRNFGQHKAITAGLDQTNGEWIVVMDCDLQDVPEEIPNLYKKTIDSQCDVVFARRVKRSDDFFKRLSSKMFYFLFNYLTDIPNNSEIANFGVFNKKVINVLKFKMRENIRLFPMMIRWAGFKITDMEVKHNESMRGSSSYTFSKLLDLAINTILTFSDKPLRLTIKLGVWIVLLSFLFGLYVIIRHYQGEISTTGWASLIVSIWFLGGVIISILGMIGIYLGKTFEETKQRPIYIIEKTHNIENEADTIQ